MWDERIWLSTPLTSGRIVRCDKIFVVIPVHIWTKLTELQENVDYRQLNSINSILYLWTEQTGYLPWAIKESDKDKTAFITRHGRLWRAHHLDLVLWGLTYETCLVYLDDVIVFSPDFDSHIERLSGLWSLTNGQLEIAYEEMPSVPESGINVQKVR